MAEYTLVLHVQVYSRSSKRACCKQVQRYSLGMTVHTKATLCLLTSSSIDLMPPTRVSLDSFCTFYSGNELQIAVKYNMMMRGKHSMGTQCGQVHMCNEAQNEDATNKKRNLGAGAHLRKALYSKEDSALLSLSKGH